MINIGFEQIHPIPVLPDGIVVADLLGLEWDSKGNAAKAFKGALKPLLRKAQKAKCSLCRRMLYDDYAVHLEHFIEKNIHGDYTFEVRNLSLSCGTCNSKKQGYNKTLNGLIGKRAKRKALEAEKHSPVLAVKIPANAPLPTTPESYRWVHPYFDQYSDNIEIQKGWIFIGKSRKGIRTIRSVKLNALAQIERRALMERLEARTGRLSMLVGASAELNNHRAGHILQLVAKKLWKRREASGV
ncbi:hypothetical protein ALQ72_01484 [Pseudomonas syringae pv. maculicola]|uniref:hypothetical protein n=1 Tax=Pseudomonas syringae group genomosp. 3 TaxID=251701 RepID=UPI0006B886FD|nr:hypothetical protein [Pseudomonas syringae group genomosp. 3]MBM0212202.1 hypothetical protein [Pseudomonas syringae pv. maculicola]RMM82398.1 hypothetical protein ALQ72_01484 [Pseudomonas syringae pv. maculicola]